MSWLLGVSAVIVLLFSFVVLFGAPYLPTLRPQQRTALDLLDLRPGQTLVELGSGDGRMLRAAAERGIQSIGYELNPLLILFSYLVTYRYRRLIRIRWANFWTVPLPECDGIYVFLLERYMGKLNKKIIQEIHNPVKLVSFAFRLPKMHPVTEENGLYLYKFTTKKPTGMVR